MAYAGPFNAVVVYGDSLSDNGNLFALSGQPGFPYFQGRRSNGPVAVEQLAASLNAPLVDLAFLGATTGIGNLADGGTPTSVGSFGLPGMLTEYAGSRATLTPYLANGLFVVWGGADDFLSPSPMDTTPQAIITRAVNDELTIINGLLAQGAQHILVAGLPDLGLTPDFEQLGALASAQGSAATDIFNAQLFAALPSGVTFYNTATLLRAIVANPAAYGLTNVTDPCFNGTTVCSNPSQYLFFDGFHPTTAADQIAANAFLSVVTPEPSAFVLLCSGLAAGAMFWKYRAGRNGRV